MLNNEKTKTETVKIADVFPKFQMYLLFYFNITGRKSHKKSRAISDPAVQLIHHL